MKETTDPSSCMTSNTAPEPSAVAAVKERLLSRAIRTETGCILWSGGMDINAGYGKIRIWDGTTSTHRLAYELAFGPIPDGLQVDHTCHTKDLFCVGGPSCIHRRCINPDHLEAVTLEENGRRAHRSPANQNARRTACVNGHPFDEANTILRSNGTRRCRECGRERDRRRAMERRQARLALKATGGNA